MNYHLLLISTFLNLCCLINYSQELNPYIKVGILKDDINISSNRVQVALESEGFQIIGSYNPEEKPIYKVLVFTRGDLQQTALFIKDKGILASVLKVGLVTSTMGTMVSYTNPTYIFNAYLREEYQNYESELTKIASDVEKCFLTFGNENEGFGGSIKISELRNYQYKALMPDFDDHVNLKTFNTFEEAVQTIEGNLIKNLKTTKLVYKEVFQSEKAAVYGVSLIDLKAGENHFLPIIGEEHIAAMPFEIVIQNNTVSMLHGRYRIALFWPDLTMGTFMKIMSTPSYIEETFKSLCK